MIDLTKTIDLSTTYLGLKLKNPLVASASPMSAEVGNVRRMEDAAVTREVTLSNDTREDPRYICFHPDVRSEVAVPLNTASCMKPNAALEPDQ